MRIWRGRHAGPLLTVWAVALVLVGVLYEVENIQPAIAELLVPLYVIIVVTLLAVTWKWFRERQRGGGQDRRHRDRRHTDRRHDGGEPSAPAGE